MTLPFPPPQQDGETETSRDGDVLAFFRFAPQSGSAVAFATVVNFGDDEGSIDLHSAAQDIGQFWTNGITVIDTVGVAGALINLDVITLEPAQALVIDLL